jgi:Icc-related predicted phosphoesterase
MRIVAVSDTHTFQQHLGRIPDGDVFIHAGDLVRAGTLAELQPVAEWIRSLPHLTKIVVAGNHDWCFARDLTAALSILGQGIVYLQDSGAAIQGLRFWGSPWQPEFNEWAFNLPRGTALKERWDLIPAGTDILITHGPPLGFGDSSPYAERGGDADLLEAVRRVRPTLHLFGHIHQDGGFWREEDTALANVTTWECERAATVLDIDPVTRRVTPVFVPPKGA